MPKTLTRRAHCVGAPTLGIPPNYDYARAITLWVHPSGNVTVLKRESSKPDDVLITADNPAGAVSVLHALARAGFMTAVRDSVTVIASSYWPSVAEVDETVNGHAATCPLCHEVFPIPAVSTGALIECSGCPWKGIVGAYMEETV